MTNESGIPEPTGAPTDTDLELKREELAIKRAALELDRQKLLEDKNVAKHVKSALPTVAAALVGIIGTGYVAYNQGRTDLDVERSRAEASLVLKAVETGNQDDARRNLLFLLDMGLIQDVNGRMATKLRSDHASVPVLPATQASDSGQAPETTYVIDGYPLTAANVTLDVVIGDAQIGASAVFVDNDIIHKGSTVQALVVGSGPKLINKTLVIRTIVTDINPNTNHASVTVVIRGGATGPREQTLQKELSSESGTAVFTVRVKFGTVVINQ